MKHMKYCPNCGTPVESTQAYCANCGCKLSKKMRNDNVFWPFWQKGLVIGAFVAVAAFALFSHGGGQDQKQENQTASETPPKQQENRIVSEIPLKQGVVEGNNAFVFDGKLVFFPYESGLWSAKIAEDGSLYDFCHDADFGDSVKSVAIVGTDLIVGTSEKLCRTDLNDSQSGAAKLETIVEDSAARFFVYDGYVYYQYGYTLYRVPMQGGEKMKLADNTEDYVVTNQGIFVSDKDGAISRLSYDGTEKKRLFFGANEEPYLSAGENSIYVWYNGNREVDRYVVSTDEKSSLDLPGWTGNYGRIDTIWEAPRGLIYSGDGFHAWCFDLAAGNGAQISESFNMPSTDVAFYGDFGYWSTEKGIYWCNTNSAQSGSYEPERDGFPEGSQPDGVPSSSDVGSVVETELFRVTIPASWVGKVTYQIHKGEYKEYTLSFYQKAGQEANIGGCLFSISLYMEGSEDLEQLPAMETLGRLIYKQAEVYTVVAEYPTDVQFTAEGEAEYRALQEDIDGILDSLTVNSMYIFQKN